MQHHMSIDIETRSSVPITDAGAYKYAQSDDFEILLFAYAIDDEPVEVIDLTKDLLPTDIKIKLQNPNYIKHAYNAAFEWLCLNQSGFHTPLSQWQCTMVHSLYCGYPAGLAATGAAIGLPEDKQKLSTGKALIRHFCVPARATRSNGGRPWNLSDHDPDKWKLFMEYNRQDVEAERSIWQMIRSYPVPEVLWDEWRDDVKMNADGVRIDRKLVNGALAINERCEEELMDMSRKLTGLANPNSAIQLRGWLEDKGIKAPDLTKATVSELLKEDIPGDVKTVLKNRQMLGKTSIKKYFAMVDAAGPDDRIRGLTQFYGANRTGRWAGRLVQMQNLPRNHMKTLNGARNIVSRADYDMLHLFYGNIPDTLSQLIRTAFIPSDGNKFVVADFSAIEARVIAWLAGEAWAMEEFSGEGKIYEATAAQMFGVPKDRIKKGNPEYTLRQKGKVATLALGYQGGPAALTAMGALQMGIPEEELQDIVDMWRAANPNIVKFWYEIGDAAIGVCTDGKPRTVKCIEVSLEGDTKYNQCFMTIKLPSGRKLYYVQPYIKENRFGRPAVHYMSLDQETKKWGENSTYGGKLTENIVQAIARDCLAVSLERIRTRGCKVVFHVHDEVIIDAPPDVTVEEVCGLMGEPIDWAPGLVLKAAGFDGEYYKKD